MITSFPVNPNNNFVGGLMKFWFITTDDILTEPEIFEGRLIGDYTFKPEKQLLTGLFDKESAVLAFNDNSNNKGALTKNEATFDLADNSPELDQLFCEMHCKKFIVFIADNYKNVRVMGRKDNGAIFSFSFTTAKKRTDQASYQFKFYTETACILPITTTQITDIC